MVVFCVLGHLGFSRVCESSFCGPSCLLGVVSKVPVCGFVFLCLCLRFVVLEVGLWGFVVLLCCAVLSVRYHHHHQKSCFPSPNTVYGRMSKSSSLMCLRM